MKITPIRITSPQPILTQGTGKYNKEEVYPTTEILLKRLGASNETTEAIRVKQNKVADVEITDDLRPYQKEDVQFLVARHSAGCFNEQRTGKTPTSLVTMKLKGVKKLLIIAPASTLYTWAEECRRWYSPDAVVIDGTANKRRNAISNWTKGAIIISYECLRETTRTKKDGDGTVMDIEITGDIAWIKKHTDIDGCILDEAHRIKNHKSKQALALFSLDWIPNRLALTGTPAPGKQHEIFSILHWLYPTIFTGYWRFINYYFTQYDQYNASGSFKVIGSFQQGKALELQQFLSVISTRRLRRSVMEWLPEKDRELIRLPLTDEQKKYIDELNEFFEIEDSEVNAVNILAKLIKIRQICLAPMLLELKGKSPKAEWIKQYLKDYPEKQVIIFSNFTQWLKYLGKEIDCNNFIIGETSKSERERLKKDFQSGKIKVLLINIKAGKEGITLDNADVAIFTDKYPPIGDVQQAEDRFVATTKDKLNTGHTIIDLVMANSYEENILRLLNNNASEVDIINNYIKYIKGDGRRSPLPTADGR